MEGKIPRFLAWIGMTAGNLPAGRRVAPEKTIIDLFDGNITK